MRISFAGNRVGLGILRQSDSMTHTGRRTAHKTFSLLPDWADITLDYDPTGRASEHDIILGTEIDLSTFEVHFEWKAGGDIEAQSEYNAQRRFNGLSKQDLLECCTLLSVSETKLYITCFLPEEEYGLLLACCESFACWPNPKAYVGRRRLRLLNDNLSAALDSDRFSAFWKGQLPLYSRDSILPNFLQNEPVPVVPDDSEKHNYHMSQV